jgi:transcriptional regulator with XRE-family HTH domain
MEFNEKLQSLRKSKGLTQEELAEALYVSRTAISKWESGRGYPSIDSLKDISNYFSVSIDDLLSGEKLISIAQTENKSNIRKMCDLALALIDILSFILVVLPLYPNEIDGFVYSVTLLEFTQTTRLNKAICWTMFIMLILIGIAKLILTKIKAVKGNKILTDVSMMLGALTVLFLAITRKANAVMVAFLLLVMKGIVLFKYVKGK